ncbi:capsular polysaccharide biosynthesis protein [Halomonas sp. DP5N14-9]|uniref:capsular polysaccharide biosynthesis protein n=1 Tax=Halomonas sp. DP5N14-9 TaxID=2859075 RepID=UPI001C995D30|nr:capsular polysaccharide biosynthesis protein [Halomonas sp. DP5N14-9]MBY5940677.1 capsular polysaccharide biosynthesis protein [Halomonas sp. DP5N14-9]
MGASPHTDEQDRQPTALTTNYASTDNQALTDNQAPTDNQALTATDALARLPILAPCLPEFSRIRPWRQRHRCRPAAVLGWGNRGTTRRARRLATDKGLPFVALEDGFLRSWGPADEGFASLSLVVDHSGIHYDASRPSDLETLINHADIDATEEVRANALMARLRLARLSKYNHAPDIRLEDSSRSRVLVVDQTRDDASIVGGGASEATFVRMLEQALESHPEAEILIKIHPEVIAGRRQGHLLGAAGRPRCRLITDDINPWALFDVVEAVHVVTSQLGFEALLAGLPVTCHGLPFYAGWGLTQDRQRCARRQRPASLARVFAAAYLRYTRYANPYTGEPATLDDTLDLLEDQRRQIQRGAGHWRCYGLSRWKRGFVTDFLGPLSQVEQLPLSSLKSTDSSSETASDPAPTPVNHLVWGSQYPRRDDVHRMEDGFLRSVGLGIDLTRPLSLVIDGAGIHYDPTRPSELEELIENGEFNPRDHLRARRLISRLVQRGLSKYNDGHDASPKPGLPALPSDRPRLLVIGQVESDASVRHGACEIRTNRALLAEVRRRHPNAFLLYRPHPDVVAGVRQGEQVPAEAYGVLAAEGNITALIDQVDEVHTLTSLAGFEALLRNRPVITYGLPFYAGWGLTRDKAATPPRRCRRATLEVLVAAALIHYPGYVDPATRQPINVETAITLLERQRQQGPRLRLWQRLYRHVRRYLYGRY